MKNFDKGKTRARNKEYKKIRWEISSLSRKVKKVDCINGHQQWEKREEVIRTINELKQKQIMIPSVNPMDNDYQRMKYVRYADDCVPRKHTLSACKAF